MCVGEGGAQGQSSRPVNISSALPHFKSWMETIAGLNTDSVNKPQVLAYFKQGVGVGYDREGGMEGLGHLYILEFPTCSINQHKVCEQTAGINT